MPLYYILVSSWVMLCSYPWGAQPLAPQPGQGWIICLPINRDFPPLASCYFPWSLNRNCGISVWLGKIGQYLQLLWEQMDTQTHRKQHPMWSSQNKFLSVFTKHSSYFPQQTSIQFYNIIFPLLLTRWVWEGRQGKVETTEKQGDS